MHPSPVPLLTPQLSISGKSIWGGSGPVDLLIKKAAIVRVGFYLSLLFWFSVPFFTKWKEGYPCNRNLGVLPCRSLSLALFFLPCCAAGRWWDHCSLSGPCDKPKKRGLVPTENGWRRLSAGGLSYSVAIVDVWYRIDQLVKWQTCWV